MDDDRRFYVAEAPRKPSGRLFHASTATECLDWARSPTRVGSTRLAIWAAHPPPDEGPDVALCLPVQVFADARAQAIDVVDRWEGAWLLIESAPRRHREEAREALLELVACALAVAAAKGLDDGVDLPF